MQAHIIICIIVDMIPFDFLNNYSFIIIVGVFLTLQFLNYLPGKEIGNGYKELLVQ